jgi:LacI family transcriptional regulator, repressor for deo operon, udp, cdd, tsx, nupC, and nupG
MRRRKIKNMEEFSLAVGVSRPTVSKYFNDPDSVRMEIRSRIELALKKTDYRPNLFAINLNRKRPKNIGIIVPYIADPFYAEIIRQFEMQCLSRGYWAVTLSSHGDKQIEAKAVQTLLSLKVAGAIVAPLGFASDANLMKSLKDSLPVIFLDSRIGEQSPFFGTNNRQSVSLLVQYLCRTGELPTFLSMPPVNQNAWERKAAYVAMMEELGHEPFVVETNGTGWNFEEIGFLEAGRILDGDGFPTRTILCANDRLAFGVMAASCQRGLRIGPGAAADLRVAGHDDHPLSRYACPALTTVAQDFAGIARASLHALFTAIDHNVSDPGGQHGVRFDARLVMRASA